jgi:hypothetical protein
MGDDAELNGEKLVVHSDLEQLIDVTYYFEGQTLGIID